MAQQVQQFVPQAITYNTPRRPAWQLHMVGGVAVAVIGLILMVTGFLVAYGLPVLVIGVLYCAAALIIGMVQGHGRPAMEFPPADPTTTIRPS